PFRADPSVHAGRACVRSANPSTITLFFSSAHRKLSIRKRFSFTTRTFPIRMLWSGSMNDTWIVPKRVLMRRRRFQRGSLQKRKSGGSWNWIAFWWQDHRRHGQILGSCATMSHAEALAAMTKLLQPVNAHAGQPIAPVLTVGDWICDGFLPF